jgi:nucleoside-diphosphate-sugar epimerase
MEADYNQPVNIGSTEMVTINKLVKLASQAANKDIVVHHIAGPTGVRGRNSDNRLFEQVTGHKIEYPLEQGIANTYAWIQKQLSGSQ